MFQTPRSLHEVQVGFERDSQFNRILIIPNKLGSITPYSHQATTIYHNTAYRMIVKSYRITHQSTVLRRCYPHEAIQLPQKGPQKRERLFPYQSYDDMIHFKSLICFR